MNLVATKHPIVCEPLRINHGPLPDSFLVELLGWGKTVYNDPAQLHLYGPNSNFDIFNKVKPELGPWESLLHRLAVLLEVMRVLAMFESDGDWKEGVDTSRLGDDTPENEEAGAWQFSFGSRKLDPSLAELVKAKNITSGIQFQRAAKFDHQFAMEYEATLLRIDVANFHRLENGPLYKGQERAAIRSSLRDPRHSIYPWLRRDAVAEIQQLIGG